jgi:sigma-B regulation protein RsbU (phosphoserine phosphatase)
MQRVNRTLRRRGIEGLFCTLAYALFDFEDRTLRLANSGLPHPLHYRATEGRAAPLDVSGLPLGTFDGVSYDEIAVELGKGDVVVFFSDGLVEARRGREDYGTERLLRGLEEHAALPAPELGERLLGDLEAFLGETAAADDVTLIVVKVL